LKPALENDPLNATTETAFARETMGGGEKMKSMRLDLTSITNQNNLKGSPSYMSGRSTDTIKTLRKDGALDALLTQRLDP